MCFHVIPAVQIYREVGTCHSDTIRITEDGCEALSEIQPRALIVR